MQVRSAVLATVFAVIAMTAAWAQSDEEQFQALGAALRADDAERQAAIDTCVAQGIGDDPAGAAQVMGVPVEKATKAWCMRMTNGIATGELTLADVQALNEGNVTPGAAKVLTTAQEGE